MLFFSSLQGCHRSAGYPAAGRDRNTNQTAEYFFVMEEAKQRELIEKLAEIRIGEPRAAVIKHLGPPTYDRPDVTKEGKFLGRSVCYYVKIRAKGLVSELHDRYIRLDFNDRDELSNVVKKLEKSNPTP
jgi:hypothetical protein